jgi:Cof subfamily protein (haloacid dehalogenase superfamily)
MRPRLVATDLDGTLLTSAGTISPRTRLALSHLERLAVPVVIVTGRPVRWMHDLWDVIGGHSLAVLSNGAIVYDVGERRIRSARMIDPVVAAEVAGRLRRRLPGTAFALEKAGGIGVEPAFSSRYDNPSQPETTAVSIGPLEEIIDEGAVKMLAQHEHWEPERFWAEVEAEVGHLVTTTWSSDHAMVEISAPGVTKATTLAVLAAELGVVAAEVLAFGDMPNDVAMLQWAGRSFAMGNAHPSALRAADQQAPTNDEDGVAQILETIFGRADEDR